MSDHPKTSELPAPSPEYLTREKRFNDAVKQLIDMFADTGGLIVDGAVESIPAESRPENAAAMMEAVFEYGKL